MKTPKVSVILPNYNHAPYLCERLESILTQTYKDFELLILDDGSTDDSYQIIARYERRARVRVLVNSTNSGSAFSQWNLGISLASGEYVWIAESDDSAAGFEYLSMAYHRKGDTPKAQLAAAQSLFVAGKYVEARTQASRAQAQFKDGSPGWLKADDILNYRPPKTDGIFD